MPENIAKNFWGKLGKASKGITDKRVHSWFYEGLDEFNQRVIYRNPRDIDFLWIYEVKRQALKCAKYLRRYRDPQTKVLRNTPFYQPSLQNSDRLDFLRLSDYSYFKKTKHPVKIIDLYNESINFEYVAVPASKAHQLRKRTKPDGSFVTIDYDPVTLFPEKLSIPTKDMSNITYNEFKYNDNFQIIEKKWPANYNIVTRTGRPLTGRLKEVWTYNADNGLLETYKDLNGTLWYFKYGEDGRDPQNLGMYTSKRVKLKGNNQEHIWKYGYDELGHLVLQQEPQFGEVQKTIYNAFGDVKKVWHQKI